MTRLLELFDCIATLGVILGIDCWVFLKEARHNPSSLTSAIVGMSRAAKTARALAMQECDPDARRLYGKLETIFKGNVSLMLKYRVKYGQAE